MIDAEFKQIMVNDYKQSKNKKQWLEENHYTTTIIQSWAKKLGIQLRPHRRITSEMLSEFKNAEDKQSYSKSVGFSYWTLYVATQNREKVQFCSKKKEIKKTNKATAEWLNGIREGVE